MSTKTKTNNAAKAIEAQVIEVVEKKKPGRPTVPGSKRQQQLEAQLERLKNGYAGRGRPANPESEGYKKRMKQAWKVIAQYAEAGVLTINDQDEMIKWT
tara:strand:- start:449 stop:745 length:297 start_codon:yes stop_codon:yes gene_type:complete